MTTQVAFGQVTSRLEASTILTRGARIDRSPVSGLLVFDFTGADNYYDVGTMLPNGSGITCLTCGKPGVPQRHNGNPAWHPNGNYILFQAQDPGLAMLPAELIPKEYQYTNPGFGTNNNLWLMTADGNQYWQLTNVAPGLGTLHAHFDSTGARVTWAEKVGLTLPDQQWVIKLANLEWNAGTPSLTNVQTFNPLGTNIFYETHGFSPDNQKILFSAGLPSQRDLDIYLLDIASQQLVNLTNSPLEWDEHAHFTPDGRFIIWGSARNITKPRDYFVPYLDYWIMDVATLQRQRITYFNDPGAPEYFSSGLVTADFVFGPNPKWMYAKLELDTLGPNGSALFVISLLKIK